MALSLAAAPLAFQAPVPAHSARSAVRMASGIEKMEGVDVETGKKIFDPLGLAELGGEKTLAWLRHAEIKHGRVCMAAFVGWLVAAQGVHFPGLVSISEGTTFESLSKMAPLEQWEALPFAGKLQIILFIGFVEHQTEWKSEKHYMAGGQPGDLKALKYYWDPLNTTSKWTDAKKAEKRLSELKNGRLAMLGVASVLVAKEIPGSVPVPIDFPAGGFLPAPF